MSKSENLSIDLSAYAWGKETKELTKGEKNRASTSLLSATQEEIITYVRKNGENFATVQIVLSVYKDILRTNPQELIKDKDTLLETLIYFKNYSLMQLANHTYTPFLEEYSKPIKELQKLSKTILMAKEGGLDISLNLADFSNKLIEALMENEWVSIH